MNDPSFFSPERHLLQTDTFNTPVALLVFNRPDTTRRVFDAVAKARPAKLLVVADGPRTDRPHEKDLCAQVRDIVEKVDWPCELITNVSEKNLGCQERVISGLNWVFSLVEEAIILEDDCLPDPSFFPFCAELLEKYRGDSRVAAISGTNLMEKHFRSKDSYSFSQFGGIWGWATWRSEWQRYDKNLATWPYNRREETLREILSDRWAIRYWTRLFDKIYQGKGPNTWDYQWLYTNLINNSVTVVPRVNLIRNIGFGADATHTGQVDPRLLLPSRSMPFPLIHPERMIPSRSTDRRLQLLYSAPLNRRVAGKIGRLAKGLFRSN